MDKYSGPVVNAVLNSMKEDYVNADTFEDTQKSSAPEDYVSIHTHDELTARIEQLEKKVEESYLLEKYVTKTIEISSLGSERLQLTKNIPVNFEIYRDEVIAKFVDVDAGGFGETESGALDHLKELIEELYFELTEDETEKITNLEQRLNLYQIIKKASIDIKDKFGVKIIYYPNDRIWGDPLFIPNADMTIVNMHQSILSVLLSLPKKEIKKPEIEIKKVINMDEVIDNLTNRIQKAIDVSFRDFSKSLGSRNSKEARVHVIVSFLAMLELVREGIINVIQDNLFSDIKMTKQEIIETKN